MSFLSPAFLWALPLLAIPVLIHLFGKRKREVLRWGAMQFLLGSTTPKRRLMRLRDLILMLLRVAVVLIIVGALAQPMISSNRLGATGPRDVILVLDNSMSTGRRIGNETIFERELAETSRLLKQLNPGDKVRILLTSPRPAWFTSSAISAEPSRMGSLIAQLQELRPNDGATDMLEVFQRALTAQPAGKDLTRFLTIVTDAQTYDWHADAPGQWVSTKTLASKLSPPVFTRIISVDAPAAIRNLSIQKLSADRTALGIGQPTTFIASIKNNGTSVSEPSSLLWDSNERSLGSSAIPSLEPGTDTTIRLSHSFATAGIAQVSCKLTGEDDLPADNGATMFVEVTPALRVLLVEGEPRTDPVQSASQCFLAALGYKDKTNHSASSIFLVKIIDHHRFIAEELSDVQCVVLADVPRLHTDALKKLASYVKNGGGLWITLGEQTDVRAFNEHFHQQGTGLSPVVLLQSVGDERDTSKFISLTPPAADHPATALLADLQRLDIDRVKVYRHHQFNVSAANSVPILLRAQGGAALALEKNFGRGRVIVQAFPLGLAWSNLPLCQSFVVMSHEWLWYLVEPSLTRRNLQPGESIQFNRKLASADVIAALETPDGIQAQLIGLDQDGTLGFRYAKTQLPGRYSLMTKVNNGVPIEQFVVSRRPEESNLAQLSTQQMQLLSQSGGISFGDAKPFSVPAGQKVLAQPRALAGWLLLSTLLVMAIEVAVAFWLARQRQIPVTAVAPEASIRA
jgi:hypothetical protein